MVKRLHRMVLGLLAVLIALPLTEEALAQGGASLELINTLVTNPTAATAPTA